MMPVRSCSGVCVAVRRAPPPRVHNEYGAVDRVLGEQHRDRVRAERVAYADDQHVERRQDRGFAIDGLGDAERGRDARWAACREAARQRLRFYRGAKSLVVGSRHVVFDTHRIGPSRR